MNETIKSKTKTKNKLYKQYIDNVRFESDFVLIETLITEINDLVTSTKDLIIKALQKNSIIHCCKQKQIGQFLWLFITTKKFL